MLRGKPTAYWQNVTTLLQRADLEKIRSQFPNYPHQNLLRAIQVSVEELDPTAVLETAELFVSLSLAQRAGRTIRLHELQLDYIRAQYPDRATLDLIHDAVRFSAHVIETDPWQFAPQVIGRLLPHQELPRVFQFIGAVTRSARTRWLRPVWPALHSAGPGVVRTLLPKGRQTA